MVLTSNGNTAGGDDTLTIAGKRFRTRLFMGTGKWRDSAEMMAAFEAADVEVITVALRRIDFDDPKSRSILEDIDWQKYTILPNTAGCATAEEAIRVARMARAMALGVQAGRLAYQAGRIEKKAYASASSPLAGVVR